MKKNTINREENYFLAQWIEGKLTDEELKTLVSEEEFKTYIHMRAGLEIYDALERPMDVNFRAIQEKVATNKSGKVRHLKRYWAVSIAASLVLLVGLFSIFSKGNTVVETSYAEQKVITLLDGSEAVLNAKSKISYDASSWNENRTLVLQGEAYFKVKKGSAFTVKTDHGSIEVLGTQFNVNSVSDFFEVVCYEGKVRVDNEQKEYVLLPQTSFRRINGNEVEQWESKREFPTWTVGESSFKSVPLTYVISALERQYQISFDSSTIDSSMLFTGSFSNKDLSIALPSVFKTMRIRYLKNDSNVFVLSDYK